MQTEGGLVLMPEEIVITLWIIGVAVVVLGIIFGAVFFGNMLALAIGRRRVINEFEEKKLRAQGSKDFDRFCEDLERPEPKGLLTAPIQDQVMIPPVVDRCFVDDDSDGYPD